MKYAVIAISGTQHQVQEDQIITVDKLNTKAQPAGIVSDVLLTVNDDKVEVGNPTIKSASVEYQVVKDYQGEKLKIFKFKSKSRYRKTAGFRAQLTDIKITKINY